MCLSRCVFPMCFCDVFLRCVCRECGFIYAIQSDNPCDEHLTPIAQICCEAYCKPTVYYGEVAFDVATYKKPVCQDILLVSILVPLLAVLGRD